MTLRIDRVELTLYLPLYGKFIHENLASYVRASTGIFSSLEHSTATSERLNKDTVLGSLQREETNNRTPKKSVYQFSFLSTHHGAAMA